MSDAATVDAPETAKLIQAVVSAAGSINAVRVTSAFPDVMLTVTLGPTVAQSP
jgi:hypothetical protein